MGLEKVMTNNNLESFVNLIRNQFSENERILINGNTDIKLLKEWSSLQTMIIVNEIDKTYGVVIDTNDLSASNTIEQLYELVKLKQN